MMYNILTLFFIAFSFTAGAQVLDSTMIGNSMFVNLNYAKLDSTIRALTAKIEVLEAAQSSGAAFDGTYSSLIGAPTFATVATTGSYGDLTTQLTQEEIIHMAYSLNSNPDMFDLFNNKVLDLSGLDFMGAAFRGAKIMFSDFSDTNLANADFSYARVEATSFENANLMNANFTGARLNSQPLNGCNFSGANLSGVTWTGAELQDCGFSNQNLSGIDWNGKNLTGINLIGTDLSNANLSNTDLSWAFLENTDCTGANLSGAEFTDSSLDGVDFTNADLSNAIGYSISNGEPSSWTGAYILNCSSCTCTDANNDNYCD